MKFWKLSGLIVLAMFFILVETINPKIAGGIMAFVVLGWIALIICQHFVKRKQIKLIQ